MMMIRKQIVPLLGVFALIATHTQAITSNSKLPTPQRTPTTLCSATAGALPHPDQRPGTYDGSNPIQHIIVLMQENHSFDSLFGSLPSSQAGQPRPYTLPSPGQEMGDTTVDGFDVAHPRANSFKDCTIYQAHVPSTCNALDPDHSWDGLHACWNSGANDSFVKDNFRNHAHAAVMGYFDRADLPYYYWLADEFAIGDRYFCSVMGPTYPNRSYLYAGTSFGMVKNTHTANANTIFDAFTDAPTNPIATQIRQSMEKQGISYSATKPLWKYYSDASKDESHCAPENIGDYPQQLFPSKHYPCAGNSDQFVKDVQTGNLAPVTFLDSDLDSDEDEQSTSEHPMANVQLGEAFSAKVLGALMASNSKTGYWWNTAFFLVYDENGGFYDHVAPPEACVPDDHHPDKRSTPYTFDRYGFRVPLTMISSYAKHHYVSHVIYDHTSVLKFIETKFNIPALTRRDANADSMLDLFDFSTPPRQPPSGAPSAEVVPCPSKLPNIPGCVR
jgi:phospholipase C